MFAKRRPSSRARFLPPAPAAAVLIALALTLLPLVPTQAATPEQRSTAASTAHDITQLRLDNSASVRVPTAVVFSSAIQPGAPRDVAIAGHGGIPARGAGSVVLAVSTRGNARASSVIISPVGDPAVRLPVVTAAPGREATGQAVIKLGRGGAIRIQVTSPTTVVLRTVGWYPEGDTMFPTRPTMVMGTISQGRRLAADRAVAIPVAGKAGIPAGAAGMALINVLSNGTSRSGELDITPGGLRTTAAVSVDRAAARAEQLLVPLTSSGSVRFTPSTGMNTRVQVVGWAPAGTRRGGTTSGALTSGGAGGVLITPSTPLTLKVAGKGGIPAAGASLVGINIVAAGGPVAGRVTVNPSGSNTVPGLFVPASGASSRVLDAGMTSRGNITLSVTRSMRVRVGVFSWQPKGNGRFSTLGVPKSTILAGPGDIDGTVPTVVDGTNTYQLTLTGSSDDLAVGEVLAVGATATNPSGLIGKATAVVPGAAGKRAVSVDLAPLDEAFVGMDVSYTGAAQPLLRYGPPSNRVYARSALLPGVSGLRLGCKFEKPVELKMSLTASASVDAFVMQLGFGKPANFQLKARFALEPKVSISGGLRGECKADAPVIIGWSIPSPIGPIALSARPSYKLAGSVDAFKAEFGGKIETTIGVSYRNGGWNFDGTGADASWDSPQITGVSQPQAEITASAGTKLSAKMWGVVGVSMFAGPELSIGTEMNGPNYYCKAKIGLAARLSVDADFFVVQASAEFASFAGATVSFDTGLCGAILPPSIATTSLPRGLTGLAYSDRLEQANGAGPFTWSAVGLPPGLSINGDMISGTPSAVGNYPVTVSVSDKFGRTASKSFSLPVSTPSAESTALIGKLARRTDGASWYVDKRGGRHAVADGGTYDCLVAQGIQVVDASADAINGLPVYEGASCVRAEPGNIIRSSDGDAYLVNADWSRSWIPDGRTFDCLRVNGRTVLDNVPRYYLMDLNRVGDASFNCFDQAAAKNHVVRASDGTSWFVDARGDRHWIPNGGTFDCLVAQGKTATPYTIPAWMVTSIGNEYEAAQCVRTEPGNIIRTTAGDAYLVNANWTRSWIPDGGSYECLRLNGHPTVVNNVPRYYVDDLTTAADATLSCYDATAVKGKVVRGSEGKSWYVDKRGGKHWLPDGGTYDCVAAQTGGAWGYVVPASWLTQTKYEDAQCVRANPGDIIRHADGDSYLINANWTRSWIPDGGTFECLKANGHTVVDGVARYYIDDLTQGANASSSCYDSNAVNGKVVRGSDTKSWYIDKRGGKHWIPDGGTYDCIAAQTGGAYPNVVPAAWLTQPTYENAQCVRANPGDIIRHVDGDSYLINSDGTRGWIQTAGSYACYRAQGRTVVNGVPRYYIDDLTNAGTAMFPTGNCLVRRPNGTSYFVNNEGKREWVPDTPTWDCETGRGVPVINASDALIDSFSEVGWHYCLNMANLQNKIVRNMDTGAAWLTYGNNTKTWIPDEFTYNCRTAQGYQVANTKWQQYIDAFSGSTWDSCFNLDTFKNKLVKWDPEGDVYFIDSAGIKHWVPGDRYGCMVARFGEPHIVKRRNYFDAIAGGDWAVCGDTLGPNQNMDRGQWLRSSNGYMLIMQYDGNLVIYNPNGAAVWATNTGSNARKLRFDGNGAVSVQDGSGNWLRSLCNSYGSNATNLVMQTDGNLVLYRNGTPIWDRFSKGLC